MSGNGDDAGILSPSGDLSRRRFLRLAGTLAGGAMAVPLLAACGPAAAPSAAPTTPPAAKPTSAPAPAAQPTAAAAPTTAAAAAAAPATAQPVRAAATSAPARAGSGVFPNFLQLQGGPKPDY